VNPKKPFLNFDISQLDIANDETPGINLFEINDVFKLGGGIKIAHGEPGYFKLINLYVPQVQYLAALRESSGLHSSVWQEWHVKGA